jgi:hypothetical protein
MAMSSALQEMGARIKRAPRILLRCSCSMSYSGEVDSKSKKYEEPPQIRGLVVKRCNATVIIRLAILEQ